MFKNESFKARKWNSGRPESRDSHARKEDAFGPDLNRPGMVALPGSEQSHRAFVLAIDVMNFLVLSRRGRERDDHHEGGNQGAGRQSDLHHR